VCQLAPYAELRYPVLMKLYRLRYSPFARKIQMLLDLLGRPYEIVEVKYGERSELAELTGGYIYVPVLVDDAGKVHVESRRIAEHLLAGGDARARLTPKPLAGPIWGYADFCDGPLEDILFRIASPLVKDAWQDPWERALYVLTKERKFGAGCVEEWRKNRDELLVKARALLAPSVETLREVPFVFGERPTFADCALYGNLAMLHEADPTLVSELAPELETFRARLAAVAG
jgi:glutathione S-transferase